MAEQNTEKRTVLAWLFGRNWLTLLGASIATASILIIAAFVLLGALGIVNGPYIGIIAFLVSPGFFIAGLIFIPIGAWWDRRQRDKEPRGMALDFGNPRVRRAVVLVAVLTIANLFIIGSVSYKGVVYMESVEFCGQVCHTVMEPEFTAHQDSPHSRVHCVECHIGPGAPWFVRSKLAGVRQVFAVLFHAYDPPIPVPVENLRPAREICEQCHAPNQFVGDRIKFIHEFSDDEENTPMTTALLMHVGGGGSDTPGIHSWHINPDRVTRYLPAAEDLQEIALVRVTEPDGTVTNYAADDFEGNPDTVPVGELKLMDCIDCHNRPTHVFHLPDDAINTALAAGEIDSTLPYIKKVSLDALEATKGVDTEETEMQGIAQHVRDFYGAEYPDLLSAKKESVEGAITALQAIYQRNIFPEMNLTWGTYPTNIGHDDFPGCFRCHDDGHKSSAGAVVSSDCDVCHTVLAYQEEDPEIMHELGLE